MPEGLPDIFKAYSFERKNLIPILQKVQKESGYLPEEAISEIARFLRLSKNEVFGVASFYAQFRFERPGEHTIKICEGTACHVGGSARILEELERELGIQSGETTKDRKFTLERVACVGCCALAPVMVMDNTVHAKMTMAKVKKTVLGDK